MRAFPLFLVLPSCFCWSQSPSEASPLNRNAARVQTSPRRTTTIIRSSVSRKGKCAPICSVSCRWS
jgi:hypothetical protein